MKYTYVLWLALLHAAIFAQNTHTALPLSSKLTDISGCVLYNELIYAINDAGDAPALYEINPNTGQLTRTITLLNATNYDWEDIAQDEHYLYIGDFGNNTGNRSSMQIYKIPKEQLYQNQIIAEIIVFKYEDFPKRIQQYQNHNYDAEALAVVDGKLIIFTKNWANKMTYLYELPIHKGFHLAQKMGAYPIDGLITAADYNPINNQMILIGANDNATPFQITIDRFRQFQSYNTAFQKNHLDFQPNPYYRIESVAIDTQNQRMFIANKGNRKSEVEESNCAELIQICELKEKRKNTKRQTFLAQQ